MIGQDLVRRMRDLAQQRVAFDQIATDCGEVGERLGFAVGNEPTPLATVQSRRKAIERPGPHQRLEPGLAFSFSPMVLPYTARVPEYFVFGDAVAGPIRLQRLKYFGVSRDLIEVVGEFLNP